MDTEDASKKGTGSRPISAFLITVIASFALYFIMMYLQPFLKPILFDYKTWDANRGKDFLYTLYWFFADPTEPYFTKTLFGGVFMLLGSIIAYVLDRKRSRFRGTPIGYSTGTKWLWVLASASLSLAISVLLFAGVGKGWVATFVPYVCVPAAVILLYGGSLTTMLTGSILAALFCTPIAMFLRVYIILPLGLPGVIANVSSMWISGMFIFEICKYLPWMKKLPARASESTPAVVPGEMPLSQYKLEKPNGFFYRRMLADYSEPVFAGNEIAGLGLLVGTLLSWLLNPAHTAYGSGLLPAIMLSSLLTGAIALFVYWKGWMNNDWFPSFVPIVSAAPACVLTYGGSMWVIVISAIIGALTGPPLAMLINSKLPPDWHPVVGFTASMSIITAGTATIIMLLGQAFPFMLHP